VSWQKSLKPRQRDEAVREGWREAIRLHNPSKLVFLDETGAWLDMPRLYGWAKTSERLHDTVTKGRKGKVSLIAAVSTHGLDTQQCFGFDDVADGAAFSTYLEQVLVPTLKPGSGVVMDNFSVHHSKQVRHTLEQASCTLVYLPVYSPDLNPTELIFAKVKASLRKARAQTPEALKKAFTQGLQRITLHDVQACFKHCGYLWTCLRKML
jgi:transposase